MHLRAADAARLDARPALPEARWSAHRHDNAQVTHARDLGADFAVLGPVLDTPSHPARRRWAGMASWPATATPAAVYALGGQSEQTVSQALRHGAHIAGIHGLI